jgi:hypothetical protein
MATKSNLNKLLSEYANEHRKAKAAWKKAIMKIHPNKGGNTLYFQEMSRLFNTHYKGKNEARIPNTLQGPSPLRRPSPQLTRANVNNALLILKKDLIMNGVRYKVYNWPDTALSSTGRMQAKKIIKRIIPNIHTNAYSFKYPTRKRVEKYLKNREAVNRAINKYFSKHH